MSGHITLVIGGARSGKSAWADQHAKKSGRQVLYVATATAGDDEMADASRLISRNGQLTGAQSRNRTIPCTRSRRTPSLETPWWSTA